MMASLRRRSAPEKHEDDSGRPAARPGASREPASRALSQPPLYFTNLSALRLAADDGPRRATTRTARPDVPVSAPDDPSEREADRVAEQVMRAPAPAVQRACACGGACSACKSPAVEEEEEAGVVRPKRAAGPAGAQAGTAPPGVRDALGSPGRPLDAATSAFFGERFGYDFGQVRVHTGAEAAASAESLGALAYTFGRDVVFAEGRYEPHTEAGRRLLAHELTHVVQQRPGVVQRACSPDNTRDYDARAAAARRHAAYRALRAPARAVAEDIIRIARSRDNCLYYMEQLERLLNTPDAPREEVALEQSEETQVEAAQEQQRLQQPAAQSVSNVEEERSAASGAAGALTRRRGRGGVFFYVDQRDPNRIVVRARVRLQARGRGSAQDVANVRSLEDGIEKHSSTTGYTVDLVFVDAGGPDVFTVGVDPSQPVTATNWVGDDLGLAHELHHLLGLGDRYDYITSHAANPTMPMADRLHWFRVQLRQTEPENPESIMGGGAHPLDDDVCRVAGLDLATCTTARQQRRAIEAARHQAFIRCQRAYEILSGITPASPFDRPGYPTRNQLDQAGAWTLARRLFGEAVSLDQLTEIVGQMRSRLTPGLVIEAAPAGDAQCSNRAGYVTGMRPPVRLCPTFFTDSAEQQVRTMIHEAAHLVRISEASGESYCGMYDCQTSCGGFNTADTWAHFIHCLSTGRADSAALRPPPQPPPLPPGGRLPHPVP